MKISTSADSWLTVGEVTSTQEVLIEHLEQGSQKRIVLAASQTSGRGRFDRRWESPKGSLAMSVAFTDYANHPAPWLIGMACAVAAAGVLHCGLQWPNDLVIESKKLGGILTQVISGVPIVGIGINLSVSNFPVELAHTATSLHLHHSTAMTPEDCAKAIVNRLAGLPEPDSWSDLEPIWKLFDRTPGKLYRLDDDTEATAIGIGPTGEMIVAVDGETRSILAADAIMGA